MTNGDTDASMNTSRGGNNKRRNPDSENAMSDLIGAAVEVEASGVRQMDTKRQREDKGCNRHPNDQQERGEDCGKQASGTGSSTDEDESELGSQVKITDGCIRKTLSHRRTADLDVGDGEDVGFEDVDSDDEKSDFGNNSSSRHTKLTDLELKVRALERENLHLKQSLLLRKNGYTMAAGRKMTPETIEQKLNERTRLVHEMVDQLNAQVLTLGGAARVWHENCRVSVGVQEWDAIGRLETISLWNMIRSVFSTVAVDIVELRPHVPDGEMILTKWRVQGEIASPQQLQTVISSEDCTHTMRVLLKAIKSSDLTFTVTTYVIFQDSQIALQHHCWDQVGVFKRLFGGEIPPTVKKLFTASESRPEML